MAPTASLRDPDPFESDGLTRRAVFSDMTGDGALDILTIASGADSLAATDTGRIHVWPGGAPLVGTPPPLATLTVPAATTARDRVGSNWRLVDWNGDGSLDLFAGSSFVDVGGVVDTGAMYFWNGSALSGSRFPDLSLTVPGATADDRLR